MISFVVNNIEHPLIYPPCRLLSSSEESELRASTFFAEVLLSDEKSLPIPAACSCFGQSETLT